MNIRVNLMYYKYKFYLKNIFSHNLFSNYVKELHCEKFLHNVYFLKYSSFVKLK